AIVLGKTNLPQLMTSFESDNPLYGRTNNPWNLKRSAGGSTSGEGAIIACGGSPLGLGSDGAGSIRQPSHACAICGLKATHGRFSMLGHAIFDDGSTYTPQQAGPMARCVDDLVLGMSVLAAGGWRDVDKRVEHSDWPTQIPTDVRGMRVGVYVWDGILDPSPAIRRAVREAAEALSRAGAIVESFTLPDPARAVAVFFASAFARGPERLKEFLGKDRVAPCAAASVHPLAMRQGIASALAGCLDVLGQRRLGVLLRILPDPRKRIEEARAEHVAYRQFFLEAMRRQRLDAVLGPTTGTVALPHGTANIGAFTGMYTVLYNALGLPAGVAPVTRVRLGEESDRRPGVEIVDRLIRRKIERGSTGMPVGVQVAGPPWREDVVLAVMRAIEREVQANGDADYPRVPIDPVRPTGR
ncbi:MAG: hypothetical protein IT441_07520, partial [Phycisphaeraceae bacterium]|nr:hypothetical protein [Phycisphaeraceae bacterium]